MSLASQGFSVASKIAQLVGRLLPNGVRDPVATQPGEIGRPADRLDGPDKAAGRVRYTAEHDLADLAHAVAVASTIARGRVAAIDTTRAATAPGVVLVMTHENAPPMKPTAAYATLRGPLSAAAMSLPILTTDEIFWNGQPIAVVVAESREQAQFAASLIHVDYAPQRAALSMTAEPAFTPAQALLEEAKSRRGNTETALRHAAATVEATYTTPLEYHTAMEPHATVASWNGNALTVFDTSQYPYGVKEMLAKVFGIPKHDVHVLAPFIGGGFGSKTTAWPHVALTVAAAKLARRPVKLVLSRRDTFLMTGGRSPTRNRIALGADRCGRLTALEHGALSMCTRDEFAEAAIVASRHLYACPNIRTHQQVSRLDRIQNAFFRAPGAAPGSFALESAMDELAWKLGMDPLELRRRNEPDRDPATGARYTSRYLREAYALAAEKFGWPGRIAPPRTMRQGRWLIGYGMASAVNPYAILIAGVRLHLAADGAVTIHSSTNELGAGTSTAQSQAAAQRLGLPLDKVRFVHGDSDVAKTRIPGASAATTTIGSAVWNACDNLVRELVRVVGGTDSPLAGCRPSEVQPRNEGLYLTTAPELGETYQQILARAGLDSLEVTGKSALPLPTIKRTTISWGAHCCEVRVDEVTDETRVARWVSAFDGGRIINPKQATSQMRGGIIMGIGMALTEQTLLDERTGRIPNATLAEYHVPTHVDIPTIDVDFVDRPDPHTPLGAKGIGELGIVGVAAAIANAVYHATGRRVRDLPITPDKLI
ncbi:xanthine dehydrogenase family protein molybdopterin-binding subunit [Mycobacterium hubeiense]|uniref:xanthine dehydrogenase family protein molybdopterin-binding subunit n=1 Tax=Mycobacterium hubeiense TaxID=1867256 RepID=UPI000C7EE72A|nr:xanthine dehydrogenase family protein molybdopterin-binding subunit [Mycobacterium sp. QGD 101]